MVARRVTTGLCERCHRRQLYAAAPPEKRRKMAAKRGSAAPLVNHRGRRPAAARKCAGHLCESAAHGASPWCYPCAAAIRCEAERAQRSVAKGRCIVCFRPYDEPLCPTCAPMRLRWVADVGRLMKEER